jgi:hypothetical protein
MDPSDKKRAQPSNFDSAAAPPSKRRQMSSDAAGASDQQSAAASAHPMAVAAAAADPTATQAVVAPPTLTCSSDSAASRLSPAERCDQDSLSVALSFLDAADFAAAGRVCRHWQRAAELQSAWPEFSVERLISGLVEDERHWTQSRSVRVNADQVGANALERLAQSPKWRRLSELHLNGVFSSQSTRLVQLSQVVQLPHLRSLRLEWVRMDMAAGFGSLAPRLQALNCEGPEHQTVIQPHLHLLTNLRVLVLDDVDGRALLPLHQLEYLQLHYASFVSHDLLLAIRRLSARHRLRHLSLTSNKTVLDLNPLVAELSGADSGLAPAALVSIHLRDLSDESRSALLSLPSLTRLHWMSRTFIRTAVDHGQSSPPSSLRQLHLDFDWKGRGDAVQLLQQAAVRAPQLRELHMRRLPPSFDHLIRPLRSLRLLEIALSESSELSPELLQALASLPLFTELMVWKYGYHWQPISSQLTSDTLRFIVESPSWRLIRLVDHCRCPELTLPGDVDAQLAERLADFRVQVEWRGRTTSHRLTIGADGTAMWQQTAI